MNDDFGKFLESLSKRTDKAVKAASNASSSSKTSNDNKVKPRSAVNAGATQRINLPSPEIAKIKSLLSSSGDIGRKAKTLLGSPINLEAIEAVLEIVFSDFMYWKGVITKNSDKSPKGVITVSLPDLEIQKMRSLLISMGNSGKSAILLLNNIENLNAVESILAVISMNFNYWRNAIDKAAAEPKGNLMTGKKTVIVHPAVWKDEKEAQQAASDWKYREFATAQRELGMALKGK